MGDNFQWSSEPRALPSSSGGSSYGRMKYRAPDKMGNLMHDRRVRRGITNAPKGNNSRNMNDTRRLDQTTKRKNISETPVAMPQTNNEPRVATPPPPMGRKHESVQTIDFLEDLRVQHNFETTETQTDADMDVPTEPLFNPMPSGPSKGTQIKEGDLFDFFMEVSPILDVLVSKSLDQAIMEVLEEDEEQEIMLHKKQFLQERNNLMASVQSLTNRENRLSDEVNSRLSQSIETDMIMKEEEQERNYRSDTNINNNIKEEEEEEEVINNISHDQVVRTEIDAIFYPWLMNRISNKLQENDIHRQVANEVLLSTIQLLKNNSIKDQVKLIKTSQKDTNSIWLRAHKWGRKDEKMKRENLYGNDYTNIVRKERYFHMASNVENILRDTDNIIRIQSIQRARQANAIAKLQKQRFEKRSITKTHVHGVGSKIVSRLPAYLGCDVEINETTGELLVLSVDRFAGCAQSSVIEGDIIISIDNNKFKNKKLLDTFLYGLYPGDLVELDIKRVYDNRREIITLELFANTNRYTQHEIRQFRKEVNWIVHDEPLLDEKSALDILSSLKPTLDIEYGDIDDRLQITSIKKDGLAYNTGLNVNDQIIHLLDRKRLSSTSQIEHRINQAECGSLAPIHITRKVDDQVKEVGYDFAIEVGSDDVSIERIRSLRRIIGKPFAGAKLYNKGPKDLQLSNIEKTEIILGYLKPSIDCTINDNNGNGVIISSCIPLGSAMQAGLVDGDIIMSINNINITNKKEFYDIIKDKMVGDVLKLLVHRCYSGNNDKISLELYSLPDSGYTQTNIREMRQMCNIPASITQLFDKQTALEEVSELEVSVGFALLSNVCVTELQSNSTAAKAGLKDGDIITHINNKEITSNDIFSSTLASYIPGDHVEFKIKDNDNIIIVELAAVGDKNSVEWVRCLRSMAIQDNNDDDKQLVKE